LIQGLPLHYPADKSQNPILSHHLKGPSPQARRLQNITKAIEISSILLGCLRNKANMTKWKHVEMTEVTITEPDASSCLQALRHGSVDFQILK